MDNKYDGYVVQKGYIGIMKDGTKMLFDTEEMYKERRKEEEEDEEDS